MCKLNAKSRAKFANVNAPLLGPELSHKKEEPTFSCSCLTCLKKNFRGTNALAYSASTLVLKKERFTF